MTADLLVCSSLVRGTVVESLSGREALSVRAYQTQGAISPAEAIAAAPSGPGMTLLAMDKALRGESYAYLNMWGIKRADGEV